MLRLLLYACAALLGLGVLGYFTVAVPIVDGHKNTLQAELPATPQSGSGRFARP